MVTIRSFAVCFFGLFAFSACSSTPAIPVPGEIQTAVISDASAVRNPEVVFVVKAELQPVSGAQCNYADQSTDVQACMARSIDAMNQSHFRKLSPVFLRSALMNVSKGVVADTFPRAGKARRLIASITITEFVSDVEADKAAQERLRMTLGWAISSATSFAGTAAGTLGPIGALVQGFDVITGIPTAWKSADKKGVVVADIKIIDAGTGKILISLPVAGTFGLKMSQVGDGTIGSYRRTVDTSSPEEALRAALAEAAKLISEKLKLT